MRAKRSHRLRWLAGLLLGLALGAPAPAPAAGAAGLESALRHDWHQAVQGLLKGAQGRSALFVLDSGEHALRIRAWLAEHARRSLDIQTFIWSEDNVGRLSQQALLAAARRGVHCRVLLDDLMQTGASAPLLALDAHPNIEIKVYNPNAALGTGLLGRARNVLFRFRAVNQRMHHKAFVADGLVGITGGRNMAEEYFDLNHGFNFRDRDLLGAGPVAAEMQGYFDEFWASPQAVPLAAVLPAESAAFTPAQAQAAWAALDALAADPRAFDPALRQAIEAVPAQAAVLLKELDRCPARFLSDRPGKNDGSQGLGGGGELTAALAQALQGVQHDVLIQSPYVILSPDALKLFDGLCRRGVRVRISTNSAANNDNLQAVAGYQRQRQRLLDMGVDLYEQKPYPANQARRRLRARAEGQASPIFVIHAKTMVLDGRRVFIGTFNLDPRSMNLNTEAGILAESPKLAREVTAAIEEDLLPENSWRARDGNGDAQAPFGRRVRLWFWRRLPLEPIL